MKDECSTSLSREEQELITYFRALPLNQQMDILGAAETRFNSLERMKQLAARQVERRASGDETDLPNWH